MTVTLDTMRADVAKMLHMAPADLPDDENLLDLGLDSLRVMTLAMKWEQEGATLDFASLAEHTTLEGWWGVISGT